MKIELNWRSSDSHVGTEESGAAGPKSRGTLTICSDHPFPLNFFPHNMGRLSSTEFMSHFKIIFTMSFCGFISIYKGNNQLAPEVNLFFLQSMTIKDVKIERKHDYDTQSVAVGLYATFSNDFEQNNRSFLGIR